MNKAILEIKLPHVPDGVRKSIALMLNELFVSVFPQTHQYVSALTNDADREFMNLLDLIVVNDEYEKLDSASSIFIVEDSMVDLGLIVAVERNWERFLDIVTDYLRWNATPQPQIVAPERVKYTPVFPDRERNEKKGWLKRLWSKVTNRRKGKKQSSDVEASETSVDVSIADVHEGKSESDGDTIPNLGSQDIANSGSVGDSNNFGEPSIASEKEVNDEQK